MKQIKTLITLSNFNHMLRRIATSFSKFYFIDAYALINQNLCKLCLVAKQCIGESYLGVFQTISTSFLVRKVSVFSWSLFRSSKVAFDKLYIDSFKAIEQAMHRSFLDKPESHSIAFLALKVNLCIGGRRIWI